MNATDNRVVTLPSPTGKQAASFVTMQTQMESELEKRRQEWEQDVLKMQEDFFKVKINENINNANNKNVNKTLDIQVPASALRSSGPSGAITEIGNPKTAYEDRSDGGKVLKFQFNMRGFDPRAMSVRAEGSKLLVTAKLEQELAPGNKSTRQFTRQVDIPPNVDADDFASSLSSDGVLTIEAPVDTSYTPSIEPPAYDDIGDIGDDDVYYVTQTSPKEHYYSQSHHTTSPFAVERYNLHTDREYLKRQRPAAEIRRYSTSSYREPLKVTRYFSDYQDPGPLYPHSRGELLRNASPKASIYHTPVVRAKMPVIYRHTPGSIVSSSVTSSAYRDTPDYHATSAYGSMPRKNRSMSLPGASVIQGKSKPKVTIIREYETTNGNICDTATSPTTKTSIFEEFRPRDTSPTSPRERHESTSSGERIITPTKYKKQKSMSFSSDSESNFSQSPPPQRDVIPRQLFPVATERNGNYERELTSSMAAVTQQHPNVITTDEGQRLRMQIDIGNSFKPEEITIHLHYKKVVIRAVHEAMVDGRSSRSEFSKEFELPAALEPSTVKAALNNNGRLFIGGSLMTNVDHQQVLDLVLCDMPANGKACSVKY